MRESAHIGDNVGKVVQPTMPKMVTIGAAVQDVFLSGKVFEHHIEDGVDIEEFVVGSKYELEGVTFSTGGGATNAAVTFARQGLSAAFMGSVANDPAGMSVMADLQKESVLPGLVVTSQEHSTGYSTLLVAPDGARTIFVYRGASTEFNFDAYNFEATYRADWYYISSLAGNLDFLERAVNFAKSNGIKVAINPGSQELKQASRLKRIIRDCDILSVNKEELQMLYEADSDEELVKEAAKHTPIVVMTDGPRGVTAADGKVLITAGMYEDVPVIDRTGAGDAFCSGLVSQLALGKSLKEAVIFGSANSTSVVGEIGAKAGILRAGVTLHDMELTETPLSIADQPEESESHSIDVKTSKDSADSKEEAEAKETEKVYL